MHKHGKITTERKTHTKRKYFEKIFTITVTIVLVFAFAGVALAGTTGGSWSSSTCMNYFTASTQLYKTSYNFSWGLFTPRPEYVKYANDNYVSIDNWMRAYVIRPDTGARVSDFCDCWIYEDDNASISGVNFLNNLQVRIANLEYPGQYNMQSKGTYKAEYN